MFSSNLAFSAFALFSAHVVASCSSDNCFRAFLGSSSSASAYCSSLFNPSGGGINAPTIPPFAAACSSSTSRLSSACSCILTTTIQPPSSTVTPITSTCPTLPVSTITVSTCSSSASSCPTPPSPSTITVTSVTTSTVSICSISSSSTSSPPCSCTNVLANPDFDSTVAPWQVINNDPNARWSLAPSADIPVGAYVGEWALQWSWQTGALVPNGAFGVAQTVSIPSCCVGPLMNLTFAILNPDNVCNIIFYDNLGGGELTEALNLGVNSVDLHSEWFQYDQFITFGMAQEFELQVLIECQPPASDIWIDLISLNPADY